MTLHNHNWIFFTSWFLIRLFCVCIGCGHERQVFRNTTFGYISDGKGKHAPNLRCEWLIESPDPAKLPYITLDFILKDTECVFDYVTVIDGNSHDGKVLGTFSGDTTTSTVPILQAQSGYMLIFFVSDKNYQRQGFNASFHVHACPYNCSGHGQCIDENWCKCTPSWSGEDCRSPACPNDCTDSKHGLCLLQSDKRCSCLGDFIGLGCELNDENDLPNANTWTMVYNYTDKTREPSALAGHAAVYVKPYLWIFGGYDLNGHSSRLLRYNFSYNQWDVMNASNGPSPRTFHTMSMLAEDNKHYLAVFGGQLENSSYSDELWIYSISHHSWSAVTSNHSSMPPHTCQHASSVVQKDNTQYLYVFGGQSQLAQGVVFSSEMYRLNWKTRTWVHLPYDVAGVKTSSLRLAGHSMVHDKISGNLIVFGGYLFAESSTRSNNLYFFDIERSLWFGVAAANSPKAVVFHTANVIGDYMLVYGGNTHEHDKDESCQYDGLFLYHLRCHEWHQTFPRGNLIPSGRFAHASAVSEKNLLFVHGGYDGTVLSDLLAYKIPTYATQAPALIVCATYDNRESCLLNKKCSWCSKNRYCLSRHNENMTCPEKKLEHPTCFGLCAQLKSCTTCVTLNRYILDDRYDWIPSPCSWCVPDQKCFPYNKPDSTSLCGYGMTHSQLSWWNPSRVAVNTTGMCLKSNLHSGFVKVAYYNDNNSSVPDSVEKIVQRKLEIDTLDKIMLIKIQGFLHILDPKRFSNNQLEFKFTVVKGAAEFYLSEDESQTSLAKIFPPSNPPVNFTSPPSPQNKTLTQHSRFYYKVAFSTRGKGKLKVLWRQRLNGKSSAFSSIDYEFLEPFHSPLTADKCKTYHNCMLCLADLTCAWCSGLCVIKQKQFEDYPAGCQHPSTGIAMVTPLTGLILDVSSCPVCVDHGTCQDCLTNSTCQWSMKLGCTAKNLNFADTFKVASECPDHCSAYHTCGECTSDSNNLQCVWCASTQTCFAFSHHIPSHGFGQCAVSIATGDSCVNCTMLNTCSSCLKEFGCGWCSLVSNGFQGNCLPGSFNGAKDPGICEATRGANNNTLQWNYDTCPDVDECNVEWPNGTALHRCSSNATCINTFQSYSCICNPGFSGDGKECQQVCLRKCSNGNCSGHPDYRCICDLGWTTERNGPVDCSVDCGCNFQSTCITGIGVCDRCHHNTNGSLCETCKSGFYKIRSNKTVCKPCQCNIHGDASVGMCDVATGICTCLHSTTGPNCERCLPGYYGDPRNGGRCYRKCEGRILFPKSEKSGAFGAWKIPNTLFPNLIYCMWVVESHHSELIQLTIEKDIKVDCQTSTVYVYDGIPHSNSSNAVKLASLCGNTRKDDATVFAESGFLTVVYEATGNNSVNSGLNATYNVFSPCSNAVNATNRCRRPSVDSLCPNNCSYALGQGSCKNGMCHCSPEFLGPDCNLHVSKTKLAGYWALEWDQILYSLSRHTSAPLKSDLPQPVYGHTLTGVGVDLLLFGGSTGDRPVADLYRYDTVEKDWDKIPSSDVAWPLGRYLHAAASWNDAVFVFGGSFSSMSVTNELWKLAAVGSTNYGWELMISSGHVPPLAGHTFTYCGDSKFAAIGGYNPTDGLNQNVFIFNAADSTWTKLKPNRGALFVGLFGHTTVYDQQTNLLYIYGGITFDTSSGATKPSSRTFAYSVVHRRWAMVLESESYPQLFQPPARYFHSAVYYNDGSSRGFLVMGGLSNGDQVEKSVWLFRFDCHLWTNMGSTKTQKVTGVNLYAAKLGYLMSAASVVHSKPSQTSYYLFGGNREGILLNQLQVFRVVSLCYVAKSKCDCEMLKAGCLLCMSNDDFVCAPPTGNKVSNTQCNLIYNFSSRAENSITTQSCSPSNNPFLHCSPETEVPTRPLHCSDIGDCEMCVARVPHSSASYCQWCDNQCISSDQECAAHNTSCSGCYEMGCQSCVATSCVQCLAQSQNCTWRNLLGITGEWKCASTREGSRGLPPLAIPITMTRSAHSCPANCGSHTTCESCLTSSGGSEAGSASCLWSATFRTCFSPLQSALRCFDGSCGFVVQPASVCPLIDCGRVTYCHECIRLRECGWLGLNDGSGKGRCRLGSHEAPEDTSSISGMSQAEWWYMTCPVEDECDNGNHECSAASPNFNTCVDRLDGYECKCLNGYKRPTPLEDCQPVCEPSCVHGRCIKPYVCHCDFGFTDPSCSTACNCSGLSNCEPNNKSICLRCVNNTHGANCQHCDVGFVGDPSRERPRGENPCIACETICNGRSRDCVSNEDKDGSEPVATSGPKSFDSTKCLNCSGNSVGDYCEMCKDGYFMLNNKCRLCSCNGHGNTCDKYTGGSCNCQNNTITESSGDCAEKSKSVEIPSRAPSECWKKQCTKCVDGYEGDPTDGGQCFRLVHMNQEWCFDPNLQPGCDVNYASRKAKLQPDQSLLFALHPKYTNVDIRLHVDVTVGEVDVYVAADPRAFSVRTQADSGKHVVEGLLRNRRSPSVSMKDLPVTDYDHTKGPGWIYRLEEAPKFNNYVTLLPNQALTVRGVRDRLVISTPHTGYDLQSTKFYVIILAREASRGDVTSDGLGRDRRSIASVAARGRLLFRQDQTRIDLFVFFSVFFSCFFLFLSICIVVWKIKQTVDTQQARLAHHMQLQHMASRPYACAYVYIDRSPVVPGSRASTVSNQSTPSRTLVLDADKLTYSTTPLSQGRSSTLQSHRKTGSPKQSLVPRKAMKSCLVKPSSSEGNITCSQSVEAFVCETSLSHPPLSPSRRKADVTTLRHRAGVSLDLSQIPEAQTEESRRHSDHVGHRRAWKDQGERRKRNLIVHFQSESMTEHSIPLLHSTQGYLTVVAGACGECRLTPEQAPVEEPARIVSSPTEKRTSFRHKVFRKSLDARVPHGGANDETDFGTPSVISRSISTPTLAKSHGTAKSNHRSSPRIKAPSRLSKFRLNRKRPCPVNVGPISVEPTDDRHAGVATVILQMPNAANLPCAISLGSALLSTKNMNLPVVPECNSTKTRKTLPLRKRM